LRGEEAQHGADRTKTTRIGTGSRPNLAWGEQGLPAQATAAAAARPLGQGRQRRHVASQLARPARAGSGSAGPAVPARAAASCPSERSRERRGGASRWRGGGAPKVGVAGLPTAEGEIQQYQTRPYGCEGPDLRLGFLFRARARDFLAGGCGLRGG